MKLKTRQRIGWILWAVAGGFAAKLVLTWMVEVTGIFGHNDVELLELSVNSGLTLLVAAPTLLIVRRLLSRLKYLEEFINLCAWCKKVRHGDEWIPIAEFMEKKFDTETSHGICPACAAPMRERIKKDQIVNN